MNSLAKILKVTGLTEEKLGRLAGVSRRGVQAAKKRPLTKQMAQLIGWAVGAEVRDGKLTGKDFLGRDYSQLSFTQWQVWASAEREDFRRRQRESAGHLMNALADALLLRGKLNLFLNILAGALEQTLSWDDLEALAEALLERARAGAGPKPAPPVPTESRTGDIQSKLWHKHRLREHEEERNSHQGLRVGDGERWTTLLRRGSVIEWLQWFISPLPQDLRSLARETKPRGQGSGRRYSGGVFLKPVSPPPSILSEVSQEVTPRPQARTRGYRRK